LREWWTIKTYALAAALALLNALTKLGNLTRTTRRASFGIDVKTISYA